MQNLKKITETVPIAEEEFCLEKQNCFRQIILLSTVLPKWSYLQYYIPKVLYILNTLIFASFLSHIILLPPGLCWEVQHFGFHIAVIGDGVLWNKWEKVTDIGTAQETQHGCALNTYLESTQFAVNIILLVLMYRNFTFNVVKTVTILNTVSLFSCQMKCELKVAVTSCAIFYNPLLFIFILVLWLVGKAPCACDHLLFLNNRQFISGSIQNRQPTKTSATHLISTVCKTTSNTLT